MYDVLVCGAGPAGATLASKLSMEGFRVCVLDMKSSSNIGRKVCGDSILKSLIPFLKKEIGFVPGEKTLECGIRQFELHFPFGEHLLLKSDGHIISREHFGKDLVRTASSAGAKVVFDTLATGFVIRDGKLLGVRTKNLRNKKTGIIRASVFADATGTAARLRRCLPANEFIQPSIDRSEYCVCYREIVELDGKWEYDTNHVYFDARTCPGGYFWVFPKGGGVFNIGLGVFPGRNPKSCFDKMVGELKIKIRTVIDSGAADVPVRRPLPSLVWDNFLLLGDAACFVDPISGGGIGDAIHSSVIAAGVLKEALGNGEPTLEGLWPFNIKVAAGFGSDFAKREVFKLFLLSLSDKPVQTLLKKVVLNFSIEKGFESFEGGLRFALGLLASPRFFLRVLGVKKEARLVGDVYDGYPKTPSGFAAWNSCQQAFFDDLKLKYDIK